MPTFRYSQWVGSQEIFAPDNDEFMDAIADDLMNHGDVTRALRDMCVGVCRRRMAIIWKACET